MLQVFSKNYEFPKTPKVIWGFKESFTYTPTLLFLHKKYKDKTKTGILLSFAENNDEQVKNKCTDTVRRHSEPLLLVDAMTVFKLWTTSLCLSDVCELWLEDAGMTVSNKTDVFEFK